MKEYIIPCDDDASEFKSMAGNTELIRCKDCIYQSVEPFSNQKVCMLPNGYSPLGYDEGFCSMAEKNIVKK